MITTLQERYVLGTAWGRLFFQLLDCKSMIKNTGIEGFNTSQVLLLKGLITLIITSVQNIHP